MSTPLYINKSIYQHRNTPTPRIDISTPRYINNSIYQRCDISTPGYINTSIYQHRNTPTPQIDISTPQYTDTSNQDINTGTDQHLNLSTPWYSIIFQLLGIFIFCWAAGHRKLLYPMTHVAYFWIWLPWYPLVHIHTTKLM